jgi:hypothetical protein
VWDNSHEAVMQHQRHRGLYVSTSKNANPTTVKNQRKIMNQTSHQMQVHCNGKEAVGSCQVELYTTGGAALKGVKMFVLVLFGAVLTVVLPGLHFVTVPFGVLASPFVGIYFFVTRKGAVKTMTGDFLCPECQANNHVEFKKGLPPYFGQCVQCQHDFQAESLL